jgi:shikimate kinase
MMKDGLNLVLIGMPSAGKSTIGVLLAKASGMDFLDTDILVQSRHGKRLQDIINDAGLEAFLKLEESVILSLDVSDTVIATGGSVVYSEAAMRSLKKSGRVVYLDVGIRELERRLGNAAMRGIAMRPGQSLASLFEERKPFYERHADATFIWTDGDSLEDMVARLRGETWENSSME